jgi:hypothetical protein
MNVTIPIAIINIVIETKNINGEMNMIVRLIRSTLATELQCTMKELHKTYEVTGACTIKQCIPK